MLSIFNVYIYVFMNRYGAIEDQPFNPSIVSSGMLKKGQDWNEVCMIQVSLVSS